MLLCVHICFIGSVTSLDMLKPLINKKSFSVLKRKNKKKPFHICQPNHVNEKKKVNQISESLFLTSALPYPLNFPSIW